MTDRASDYWNTIAHEYQRITTISTTDYHFGPLLPGNAVLDVLPQELNDRRCLEVGCGAGQNSIVLAKRGAECVAVDSSQAQLEHAATLARDAGTTVTFIRRDMDALQVDRLGRFDLLHSTFGLCFSADPATLLKTCAELLVPGGSLIASLPHPVFAGEWLELDGEGCGVFLPDYFNPPDEIRTEGNGTIGRQHAYPISDILEWLRDAGLRLDRLLEPAPLPVDAMTADELREHVPYYSADWIDLYPKLQRIPVAVIYVATRGN